MTDSPEYKALLAALVLRLTRKGFLVTHVDGAVGYPQPEEYSLGDTSARPDVVAAGRNEHPRHVIGIAETAETWNSLRTQRRLSIYLTNADKVYVMVPDSVFEQAQRDGFGARSTKISYLSPST